MPLTGLKLYGSTVKNFQTILGWGTEKSSVKVSLVQDSTLGDYFLPPPIGALTYVTFDSLNFWGILQKWVKNYGVDGFPTYDVEINDPRAILDGAEVILGSYNGSTFGVPNLLNVYGYYENQQFGSSLVNPSGMPWSLVKEAIHALTLGSAGNYGGPLSYKGYYYAVDLSDIPNVPSYYRVGGSGGSSLLQIIQQVCSDAGCDFFVDMEPGTTIIRVRTVQRRLQPPTGYIQALVDEATDDGLTVRSQAGLEAINQATSAFIIGAPVQVMYDTTDPEVIHPYFGKDVNGNPILSINTEIGNPFSLTASLNASEVQDIIGSYSYQCTALEMCCALADRSTWDLFIHNFRPDIETASGVLSAFQAPPAGAKMPQDMLNLTPAAVLAMAGAQVEDIKVWTSSRMFSFVRKAAQDFLGKKFLVEIPFLFQAEEPETGRIINSYDVASNGYIESGQPPLGLHPVYTNNFSDANGMFYPYSLYNRSEALDLSRINSSEFLIDIYNELGIYVSINVGTEIIFLDELTPCVEITISSPLFTIPTDATGAGLAEIAAVLQMTPEAARDFFKKLPAGNFFTKLSPLPRQPDYVTIPLKSNILCYGPWYGVGSEGKVSFQNDSTLAPWNYGGSTLMNLTANAKVVEAVTFQQASESGSVEIVEPPRFNIGDQLELIGEVLGGPTITGIDVNYGENGVTSNYRIQTFTTRYGLFSKDNVERLRRISLKNQELRRETRDAINRLLLPTNLVNETTSLAFGTIHNFPVQFQRNSPHSVFMGLIDETDGGLPRVSATTHSDKEIGPGIPADDATLYDKSAMMSLTGLIRPFLASYTSNWLANYEEPNTNYKAAAKATFLDPFKSGNDIELYTTGTSYSADAHAYLEGGPTGARGFALRGPLLISGWGTSVDNVFEPSEAADYLRESWYWKTGPVDLLWDNERKVWTPHGMMMGVITGDCNPGGSATCVIHDDSGEITGRATNRTVYNFFSTKVNANKKVIAAWIPEAQKWYIIAADCV